MHLFFKCVCDPVVPDPYKLLLPSCTNKTHCFLLDLRASCILFYFYKNITTKKVVVSQTQKVYIHI